MTKPKKIMIGVPLLKDVEPLTDTSITNFAHNLFVNGYEVDINKREGSILSTQRNKISLAALQEGFDLFFIDSDMVFSVEDALHLINSGKDIIGGLYVARRAPYMPLVFGEDLTEEKFVFRSIADVDIPKDIFPCKGLGSGFLFILNQKLQEIYNWCKERHTRPFNFMELPNGDQYGEDLSFFRRLNQMRLECYCNPCVDIGHMSKDVKRRFDHKLAIGRDFHYCNDIDGWMTVREQNWLYNKAKEMKSIFEIGCWKGKSTHALASGCKGYVVSVDHFLGSEGERKTYHKDFANAEKEWRNNVGNRFANVSLLKHDSITASKYLNEADMIFIDSGHKEEEVLSDLRIWNSKAKKIICGHDYTNHAGVQKAVNAFYKKNQIRLFDSIWYVEK